MHLSQHFGDNRRSEPTAHISIMRTRSQLRRGRDGEQGYMLVYAVFLLTLLLISMTVAAPRIAKEIQRDRELETMQRGKQYIRAIRLYQRTFKAYPPSVDALLNTSNVHYLRKKYIDPTSGKDSWKLIRYGQNKVPIAYGFFGKALTAESISGTGGGTIAGATLASDLTSGTSTTPTSTSSASSTSSTSSTTSGSAFGSGSSSSGSSIGGGAIIGVSPNSSKSSLMLYKTKNHYNEWEFTYDPIIEKLYQSAGGLGTAASSLSKSSTSTSSASSTTSSTTTP